MRRACEFARESVRHPHLAEVIKGLDVSERDRAISAEEAVCPALSGEYCRQSISGFDHACLYGRSDLHRPSRQYFGPAQQPRRDRCASLTSPSKNCSYTKAKRCKAATFWWWSAERVLATSGNRYPRSGRHQLKVSPPHTGFRGQWFEASNPSIEYCRPQEVRRSCNHRR
jgi:hypothetical protein